MDSPWTWFGKRPVIGSVIDGRLRAWKRIDYRNSFQVRLVADLVAEGGGTRLRCTFGMHPFVTGFMALWFGMVLLACGGMAAALLLPGAVPGVVASGSWLGVGAPLGMLLFGAALLGIGRYASRGERDLLLDFVRDTLGARPP